jgi:hypothetical protein
MRSSGQIVAALREADVLHRHDSSASELGEFAHSRLQLCGELDRGRARSRNGTRFGPPRSLNVLQHQPAVAVELSTV